MMQTDDIKLSVCICTRNRPQELLRALASIDRSQTPAHQVIVSDDSTDDVTRREVAANFPSVTYLPGPRRGLSANRNTALRHASGTHILFIDDDVEIAPSFLRQAAARLAAEPPHTILTGMEINHGTPVHPHKPSFLGYQALEYRPADSYETIVINATVFPKTLFETALFDENLVYGCEEMDFSVRAVLLYNHKILFDPALANAHFPSPRNRDFYAPFMEASRLYVTFKRYAWVEKRSLKALAFLLLGTAHIFAHDVRRRGLPGLRAFAATMSRAAAYTRNCRADLKRYV